MQESLSTRLIQTSQNKYPDCLWMQLEAIPVESGASDTSALDLYLTINFDEHWEPVLGGRVKLGLKGGELRLKLEGGEIPLASRDRKDSLELAVTEDRKKYKSSENKSSADTNPVEIGSSLQDNLNVSQIAFRSNNSQVNPAWIFEVKAGESILKGGVKSAKLLTVNAIEKFCRIEATFEVSKHDVYLIDAEGLWRHDISPNQHAVLERKLALFLWESKLKPCLSWAQLCYDCLIVEKGDKTTVPQIQAHLQEEIDRIIAAPTKDFLELAKIAGLDPAIDFAGGNLRGTNLNGVDLSSANLCRANLRGADLSDAELTDANLSSANLSGADLSGADLGNINLSHADLHLASLALANLSGANLSGANLVEANLSSANLGSANVKQARFGKNAGISEQMKLDLKQRGAIFE
ncbi:MULTISPECIES: pentapeptide repeat-containing protein [Aerosakkonema]|uniref:pentapeptide repeat-containing protein n=1 Tax=Aerosakkonema TaxID=1246629 RepID=UPI0035B92BB2